MNLRNFIRKILNENQSSNISSKELKGLELIEERDITVSIEKNNWKVMIKFLEPVTRNTTSLKIIAKFSFIKDHEMYDFCLDSFITDTTWVKPKYQGMGLGAVLYSLALETSGKSGLTADRYDVSPDAIRMWNYYSKNPNVRIKQLDIMTSTGRDFLTPTKLDDCNATSTIEYMGGVWDEDEDVYGGQSYWDNEDFKEKYNDSPLSKVYYKSDGAITNYLKGRISYI